MPEESLRTQPYSVGYANVPKNEDNDPRPYDTLAQLRSIVSPDSAVLDVGCGTAHKTLPLASHCGWLYGVEPSVGLLEKARAGAQGLGNVRFWEANKDALPFADSSLDVVVSLLSPHNTAEVRRVLRPGGTFYLEKVGEQDKKDLKRMFGQDEKGPRGYNFAKADDARRRELVAEFRENGFDQVRSASLFFDCYYPDMEALVYLLEHVKFTVRDFSREEDAVALNRIEAELSTPRGIRVQKHEIVVVGRKRKI